MPRGCDGLSRHPAFEACVAAPESNALQTAIAGDEGQRRCEKRSIVLIGRWIQQVDSREITFAALGGIQSCRAAHREKLGAGDAAVVQFPQQVVEADAVAPDHHKVGQLQLPAEKLNVDEGSRVDNLLVPADCRKTIRAAERRDTAGSLSHRIRGE